MNCQNFETIVNDLAGGRLWDSAKRAAGLAHSGECPRCAARLANERLLSYELVELGRHERMIQAPVQLKHDLMAAFAAQHAAPVAVPTAEIIAFPQPKANRYWAMAIAAAAVVALGLIIPLRSWFGRTEQPVAQRNPAVPAPVAPPVAPIVVPTGGPTKGSDQVADNGVQAAPAPIGGTKKPAVRNRNVAAPQAAPAIDRDELVASNTEVTTGFIPLTLLNQATAADSSVMLRVEVARDRLAAMGLPLNLDRYGETIKADIIMGDDGVARAIRLVQ